MRLRKGADKVVSMNVFELFGSIGLNTDSFDQGMTKVESGATSAMGVIGKVIDVVKKADRAITTISDISIPSNI